MFEAVYAKMEKTGIVPVGVLDDEKDAVKSLAEPFPFMKFMPTGVINSTNVGEYLCSDKIIACGGTRMVKKELIQSICFEEISKFTKEAVLLVSEYRK